MIYTDKKLVWLSPKELHFGKNFFFEGIMDSALVSLTESICENGIIEPLLVRKTSIKGYELISGFRRLAAAKRLSLRRVPCIVCVADDKTAALIRLNDNLQRTKLSFFDEAEALERVMKSFNMSYDEISAKIGLTRSAVLEKLSLLKIDLNERIRIIGAGLSEDHALLLLNLPPKMRTSALDIIVAESLSHAKSEKLINSMLSSADAITQNTAVCETRETEASPVAKVAEEPPTPIKMKIGDIRLFSNSLTRLVDTMKSAGIKTSASQLETKHYIEYKVRIEKQPEAKEYTQLKIC